MSTVVSFVFVIFLVVLFFLLFRVLRLFFFAEFRFSFRVFGDELDF